MNAAHRTADWTSPYVPLLGRLTVKEFDALELLKVMGGQATIAQLALRWDAKENTVGRRMQRMVKTGLVRQYDHDIQTHPRLVRIVVYTISETGHAMFREALAALDAACEEAAA